MSSSHLKNQQDDKKQEKKNQKHLLIPFTGGISSTALLLRTLHQLSPLPVVHLLYVPNLFPCDGEEAKQLVKQWASRVIQADGNGLFTRVYDSINKTSSSLIAYNLSIEEPPSPIETEEPWQFLQQACISRARQLNFKNVLVPFGMELPLGAIVNDIEFLRNDVSRLTAMDDIAYALMDQGPNKILLDAESEEDVWNLVRPCSDDDGTAQEHRQEHEPSLNFICAHCSKCLEFMAWYNDQYSTDCGIPESPRCCRAFKRPKVS
jgi:hypothetical protein